MLTDIMRAISRGRYVFRRAAQLAPVFLLILAGFVSLSTAVLRTNNVFAADHLVAHWKFDELNAGDDAKDSAGANDGVPGSVEGSAPIPSTVVPPS